MKKLVSIFIVLAVLLSASAVFANGQQEGGAAAYTDGVYFAQEDAFAGSGYKYFVVVTVSGGKITDAYWGGTNVQPNGDKRKMSENKQYGMVKFGKAASYWYEQAEAAEKWLIANQNPAAMEYTDDHGHTDMLKTDGGAGVSIHVIEFYSLVEKALSGTAVPAGSFKANDYVVKVKMPAGNTGWATAADFIVANGTIVDVNYNSVYSNKPSEDGKNAAYFGKDSDGKVDATKPLSKDQIGEVYGMKKAGSQFEWNEQAAKVEDYILKNQAIFAANADGKTDAIAGVSVHVNEFIEIFNKAFK